MTASRIYITYDYDEVSGAPTNMKLWWRQPPRFFYDSKVVPVDFFGYPKLTLVVVQYNDNGIMKHEFVSIAKNFESVKDKIKNYTDNINQYPDKKVVSINYLELSVDG